MRMAALEICNMTVRAVTMTRAPKMKVVEETKAEAKFKKPKLSWRKKKSWRRVDVTDLENHIEEQNLQQRLGLDFTSKSNDDLFVVDTRSSKSIRGKETKEVLTPRQKKKRMILMTEPRCFQALENDSKVPDPLKKRNVTKQIKLSEATEAKKIKSGIYKKKFETAEMNRQAAAKRRADMKKYKTSFDKDIWSENDEKTAVPEREWLTKDTYEVNIIVKPKFPARKKSKAPSVSFPHPGTSYNPSLKDHQELLNAIVTEETKIIKEEKHLTRTTSKMFRTISRDQKMREELSEMQQGLEDFTKKIKDVEDEPIEETGDSVSINPPMLNKKKDIKTRKHITQEKLRKAEVRKRNAEKKRLAQIYKLRFIEKDAVEKEEKTKEKKVKKVAKLAAQPPEPRINSRRFKEPMPVFLEPGELPGNLKNLKPSGSLLEETFTSLQRRGLAPVSVPVTFKKTKKKRFTLSSHRMPWENIETPVKPSRRNVKAK